MKVGFLNVRSATEPVAGRLEIDLGGLKVTLSVAGDCHSQGDMIVLVPSEKVAYTGDLVWSGCHPNLVAGSTFRWIGVLAAIEKMDLEHVLSGHGEPGDKQLLVQQRRYLMDLRRMVKHLAKNKVEMAKVIEGLPCPEKYAKYENAVYWKPNVRFVYDELIRNR